MVQSTREFWTAKEGGSHGDQVFPDVDIRRRHLSFQSRLENLFLEETILRKGKQFNFDALYRIVTLIGTPLNYYRIQDRSLL